MQIRTNKTIRTKFFKMTYMLSVSTMPRLITKFDPDRRPVYMEAIYHHPDLPIYLQGNSLWVSQEADLSKFWRTFEDIHRYMVVLVNFTTTRANFSDVINYRAEGQVKQETVYIQTIKGELLKDITARANTLFEKRYGAGAFKPEHWFGTVKKGDDLWPKIGSIILKELDSAPESEDVAGQNLRARFAAANKKPRHFVVWAAGMGHKIQYATVSRHMAGTQGITVPWAIAYDYFFASLEK
jgi:hypothetical protein